MTDNKDNINIAIYFNDRTYHLFDVPYSTRLNLVESMHHGNIISLSGREGVEVIINTKLVNYFEVWDVEPRL